MYNTWTTGTGNRYKFEDPNAVMQDGRGVSLKRRQNDRATSSS